MLTDWSFRWKSNKLCFQWNTHKVTFVTSKITFNFKIETINIIIMYNNITFYLLLNIKQVKYAPYLSAENVNPFKPSLHLQQQKCAMIKLHVLRHKVAY